MPKADKALPRLVGRTKVRHTALVDDADLIEEAIEQFSGLIDGDNGSETAYLLWLA